MYNGKNISKYLHMETLKFYNFLHSFIINMSKCLFLVKVGHVMTAHKMTQPTDNAYLTSE